MIPIYGLYADFDNTVVIKSEGKEKILHIKTDKLPDDFMYAEDSARDNFLFYNVFSSDDFQIIIYIRKTKLR